MVNSREASLVSELEFAHESYLRPNGHGGYIIRQSDLSSWSYCALRKYYEDRARADADAPQPEALSATEYGTVMHYVLMNMEQAAHEGADNALEQALASFEHYWQPENIGAIATRITEWLPRQTYGGLRERGRNTIRAYYDLLGGDDATLLALEYQFAVPVELGGRLHTLTGTIDRLSIRRLTRKPYLSLDDFKTGKQVTYLRHNQQGHAYAFASTQRAFWEGWPESGLGELETFDPEAIGRLEDLYSSWGYRLHSGSHGELPLASRRFRWINLQDLKYVDGGWRNERDYARLLLGIDGYIRSCEAGAYHPNLKGEPCKFCFAAETEIWTSTGVQRIGDLAGQTVKVLARRSGGGGWVDAPIRSYGQQPLRTITLQRYKSTKTIRATPEHQWFVRERKDPTRSQHRAVKTADLQEGDVLLAQLPAPRTTRSAPSPIGIQAGIVFGDGHSHRQASVLSLYGDKMADLGPFFLGNLSTHSVVNDLPKQVIHGLPRFLNERPDIEESSSYLLGWLMGYVATDGSVSSGQVIISSSQREHIELIRTVAARLGIGTYGIGTTMRVGTGTVETPLYRIQLQSSALDRAFFLRPHHRAAFVPRVRQDEHIEWRVVDVVDDGELEEVFCAEVPEHENFTLEGWINTHNCAFRKTCGGVGLPDENAGMP